MVVQTIRYGGGVSVTEKSDCFLEANIDTLAGVSELAERFARRRNSQAVRWYVLTLPSCRRGPAVGLQRELDRRLPQPRVLPRAAQGVQGVQQQRL